MATQTLQSYLKIETTHTDGIEFIILNSDNQIVAANKLSIKFYDFIDKNMKEEEEQAEKKSQEILQTMKELFQEIDSDNINKINKECMRTYLSQLKDKFGTPDFVQSASLSEECFEDVWLETDFKKTGFITWHQIKPFIQRGMEHQLELEEEQRLYEEERQRKIADVERRIEEKELARLAEIERLEAEANQNIDD